MTFIKTDDKRLALLQRVVSTQLNPINTNSNNKEPQVKQTTLSELVYVDFWLTEMPFLVL